jgi:hypothetical protein
MMKLMMLVMKKKGSNIAGKQEDYILIDPIWLHYLKAHSIST